MQIVCHGARTQPASTPNTLAGFQECVAEGFYYIEFDISPLAHGDFLLFHNEKLDFVTNHTGPVFLSTRDDQRNLWYMNKQGTKKNRVALLSELIGLLNEYPMVKEIQLDLKTHASAPLTDEILKNLLGIIAPVKNKVRVSSCADWAIRRLRHLDREIELGFDPQFFIDFGRLETKLFPPFRKSRFSYKDDHPIASCDWGHPSEYLSARAASLWCQGEDADVWYLRYELLEKSDVDGFNWFEFLHSRDTKVCAWTLNIADKCKGKLFKWIVSLQPDRISTDTPVAWKSCLEE